MAYNIVQRLILGTVQHHYDREADVLYITLGEPRGAVALQVEDWLALRLSVNPPYLAGFTIVGFKTLFERINRYIDHEIPKRVQRLTDLTITAAYDDQTDTFMMRFQEKRPWWERLKKSFSPTEAPPTLFEPLVTNVYVEKQIPSKEIMGFKILEFTKSGEQSMQALFGAIIDTVFEPERSTNENAHLIASSVLRHIDLNKFASIPV